MRRSLIPPLGPHRRRPRVGTVGNKSVTESITAAPPPSPVVLLVARDYYVIIIVVIIINSEPGPVDSISIASPCGGGDGARAIRAKLFGGLTGETRVGVLSARGNGRNAKVSRTYEQVVFFPITPRPTRDRDGTGATLDPDSWGVGYSTEKNSSTTP